MARIKFTVTYDGSKFNGWQIQPGVPTVQETIENAFHEIFETPIRLHGSGRTDAGVHALGQVFHISSPSSCRIPAGKWPAAMNSRLPGSIRIIDAAYVEDSFHARFSATGKTYRYIISTSSIFSPFDRGLVWHEPRYLNKKAMNDGMQKFLGMHDFRSFAALRGNEPTPIPSDHFRRIISRSDMKAQDDRIILTFSGNGFLYKMVRLMTGAIQALGAGRITPKEFDRLLHEPANRKSPLCAPSDGLYLVRVDYE